MGVFNINVEALPHEIDIGFIEGSEAGNWNYGIFRLDGDQLEFCFDMNGKPRPKSFPTSARSGRAYGGSHERRIAGLQILREELRSPARRRKILLASNLSNL
jgi:hypothetical protein